MRQWWLRLPPSRQDRFATLAPLLAVLLFLSAIVVAITYLRFEELEREQEAVTRDVEYAQQRLRLRLLERQEQLMRLAREVDNKEISVEEFAFQAETLISQFPELLAISWVDGRRVVVSTYASPSAPTALMRVVGGAIPAAEGDGSFELARDLRQPIYSRPLGEDPRQATLSQQLFDAGLSPALVRKLVQSLPAQADDALAWATGVLERNVHTDEHDGQSTEESVQVEQPGAQFERGDHRHADERGRRGATGRSHRPRPRAPRCRHSPPTASHRVLRHAGHPHRRWAAASCRPCP